MVKLTNTELFLGRAWEHGLTPELRLGPTIHYIALLFSRLELLSHEWVLGELRHGSSQRMGLPDGTGSPAHLSLPMVVSSFIHLDQWRVSTKMIVFFICHSVKVSDKHTALAQSTHLEVNIWTVFPNLQLTLK